MFLYFLYKANLKYFNQGTITIIGLIIHRKLNSTIVFSRVRSNIVINCNRNGCPIRMYKNNGIKLNEYIVKSGWLCNP